MPEDGLATKGVRISIAAHAILTSRKAAREKKLADAGRPREVTMAEVVDGLLGITEA